LAIVYQIVQAHEGKVWARSKLGQGSVFVLRLRRLDAAESATAKLSSQTGQIVSTPIGVGRNAAVVATGGGAHG